MRIIAIAGYAIALSTKVYRWKPCSKSENKFILHMLKPGL